MNEDKLNKWVQRLKKSKGSEQYSVVILVNAENRRSFENGIKKIGAQADIRIVRESAKYRSEYAQLEEFHREVASQKVPSFLKETRAASIEADRKKLDEIRGIQEYHLTIRSDKLLLVLKRLGTLIFDIEQEGI